MLRHVWAIRCGIVIATAIFGAITWPTRPMASADSTPANSTESISIGTFACDITPPMDEPVGLGFIPMLQSVEHPLLAKGIVIKTPTDVYVLCALDLMEVHNASHTLLRDRIAEAAGTQRSFVAVQTLHQHSAPALDGPAQERQLDALDARRRLTARYLDTMSANIASAVRDALQTLKPLTHVGTSRAMVERVASNRRIEMPDGTIRGRMSATKDASLQNAPEGLIDPWVRTVTFFDNDKPVAQSHYYATHPQSFYGDGRASYDTAGIARERLQKDSGVFQVYFTGCGGDIAMGKYNDGTPEARDQLTNRLHAAMQSAAQSPERTQVTNVRWKTVPFHFPVRRDPEFSASHNTAVLAKTESAFIPRLKAAITLAWLDRMQANDAIELSCLTLGPVQIMNLPGEPFVQYQLAAQKMSPNSFVAVAGYGDCGMGYIGGDRIFTDQGGYEQTYSFAGPCELPLLSAIDKLLNATPETSPAN